MRGRFVECMIPFTSGGMEPTLADRAFAHAPFGPDKPPRSASLLDHQGYSTASRAILAIVAGAAAYFMLAGSWYDGAALAALAALGGAFIAVGNRLPPLFTLLFLLAGVANVAGYAFDLWKMPVWFDEAVHAGTSFTGMAAAGWLILARTRLSGPGRSGRLILAVAGLGLFLGIAWELFEWLIGIIDGPADTIVDLLMDLIGATLAGLFCAWAARRRRPLES